MCMCSIQAKRYDEMRESGMREKMVAVTWPRISIRPTTAGGGLPDPLHNDLPDASVRKELP
jgi:hypothetical protein